MRLWFIGLSLALVGCASSASDVSQEPAADTLATQAGKAPCLGLTSEDVAVVLGIAPTALYPGSLNGPSSRLDRYFCGWHPSTGMEGMQVMGGPAAELVRTMIRIDAEEATDRRLSRARQFARQLARDDFPSDKSCLLVEAIADPEGRPNGDWVAIGAKSNADGTITAMAQACRDGLYLALTILNVEPRPDLEQAFRELATRAHDAYSASQ